MIAKPARRWRSTAGQGGSTASSIPTLTRSSQRIVTHRLRRDHPEIEHGKPKNKYLSAYGDRRHLYLA